MLTWILAALAVYVVQIYLSSFLFLPRAGFVALAGARDTLPERGVLAARADRALTNMKENMPLFLVPAVLAMVVPGTDQELAATGGMLYVASRIVYVALYVTGVPWIRSFAYLGGIIGCVLVIEALVAG